MYVRVCVHTCVCAHVRPCVRACVRASVRPCMCAIYAFRQFCDGIRDDPAFKRAQAMVSPVADPAYVLTRTHVRTHMQAYMWKKNTNGQVSSLVSVSRQIIARQDMYVQRLNISLKR